MFNIILVNTSTKVKIESRPDPAAGHDILGTSQTMYARYERGANELPIRHLIKLAKYYGVPTDYILGLCDKP